MTGRDSFVCPSERHRADSVRIGRRIERSGHARARRSSIDARGDDDGDDGDLCREVGASLGDSSRRGRGREEYQAGGGDWNTTRDDDDDDDDDDGDARGV